MKILLIDTAKDLTNILEKLLMTNGHHVISANDCETGSSLIYSQNFDAIVANIEICDCSRYCVIDILESTGIINNTKVMVLSESINEEDRKLLKNKGVDVCFKKPISYEVLFETISSFNEHRKIIK